MEKEGKTKVDGGVGEERKIGRVEESKGISGIRVKGSSARVWLTSLLHEPVLYIVCCMWIPEHAHLSIIRSSYVIYVDWS